MSICGYVQFVVTYVGFQVQCRPALRELEAGAVFTRKGSGTSPLASVALYAKRQHWSLMSRQSLFAHVAASNTIALLLYCARPPCGCSYWGLTLVTSFSNCALALTTTSRPTCLSAVVPGTPVEDVKLLVETVSSLVRANALRTGKGINVSFGSKSNEEKLVVS